MSISSGAVSGIDELLALLSNPDQLRATLKELKAAAQNAEAQITLAAPASEILPLREKLRIEVAGIADRENKARLLCESLAETAKAAANEVLAKARAESKQIVDQASAKLADARKQLEQASAKWAEVDSKQTELQQLETRLKGVEAVQKDRDIVLAGREAGVERERQRLADLASKLQAALG